MTKLTSILLQLLTIHNQLYLINGKKSGFTVPSPVTANADSFSIESNSLSHFNVLGNDSGDGALYIQQVTEPQHGYLAVLDGNVQVLYAPDTDFVGLDSFNYTVCDSSDSCASAKVDIRIGSSDESSEGPVPNTLLAETNELTHFNVLDYNPAVPLSGEMIVEKASKPQHGSVIVLSGGQKMIYSPDKGYEGEDSFTLAVCNPSKECSTIDINVKVGRGLFHCNKSTQNTVNIGYYQSWAIYRNSACNPMYPKDIQVDDFGYTHLVFSFGGISRDGKMEPYNGNTEYIAMYQDFNNLKLRYPELKTMIAVGGWSFEQSIFSEVAASVKKREYFAKSVVEFLKTYGFDGIDLDWEYPVTRQGTPADYQNYPLLCEALRKAFDEAGQKDWVISVATTINPNSLKQGYAMVKMAQHIDWFNMMTYDIYGSWDSHAGANTDMQYITKTMNYIYELGIQREKLVFGMAAYGRSMSLKDQNCIKNGCEVTGAGLTGCHGEMGNLPYFQIDEMVKSGDYDSLTFNSETGSMEMVSGNSWTSYDSEDTLNIKYRYAYDQCLRGIMWWAVDLLKKPIELYESQPSASPSISIAPTPYTKSPTLKPTRLPTTSPTKTRPCGLSCPEGAMGLLPMFDCVGYYSCETGIPSKVTPCPPGTIFDEGLQTCNWPWATSCSCTKDTKEESVVLPSSSKTPPPSPIPEKVCNTSTQNTVNFGYYESWASGRWCNPVPPGAIDVDAFGYTHLAFSFAGISWEGELEPYDGDANFIPMFKSFNSLKKMNLELKTLIAVGGWTFPQKKFVSVSSTEEKRAKFAKSVVRFLKTHGFDGIDLDWEYPVTRQGTPADYDNYPLLCEAIRNAFNEAGQKDWLITVATTINPDSLKKGYDMVNMAPHIDWFNMMSYDIHGSWDARAGANADMQYIKKSMHYIFGLGVPREKLVLGLAGYGRSMLLSDPTCTTDGCPVEGAGLSGCHGEGGNLPYFQIDEDFIQTGDYDSLLLNETTGSMELVTGGNRFFTSYDSPESLGIKYRYAFHECLRGIMWWAVDLIKEPMDLLGEYKPSVSPSVSIAPSTETRHPTTSPTVAPTIRCGSACPPEANGFFPTMDCLGYFECKDGFQSGSVVMCHGGLVFNEKQQRCDWDYNTQCQCTSKMFPPTTAQPTNKPPSSKPTKKPVSPPTTAQPTRKPISAKPTKKLVTNNPTVKENGQMQQQSSPTGSAPNDDAENKYYPDYDKSTCRHIDIDGKAPEFETNFFSTFETCCEFAWIDTEKCLSSKPNSSKRWYPSENEYHCKNDDNPPPNVALSKSYKICCDRFMSSHAEQCYSGSKTFDEGDGTTNMQQNSSPAGSGGVAQAENKDYYPDYDKSTCRNDGQSPEFETNFFSTFDACCEFAWIDTEKCLASKKPISEWYPVSDGSCSNTGVPPKNIALSKSLSECCNRFFPYSDCVYRSNFEESQSMTGNKSNCSSLTKKKCNQDDSCTWNEIDDTCSDLSIETTEPTCGSFTTKKQCKREPLCSWNDTTSACESLSVTVTSKPSNAPTAKPTNQSIVSSMTKSCASLSKKKQCKQNSACAWNDEDSLCEEQGAGKIVPNLSVAICSTGQCLDLKGQCMPEYNCLVDPCMTKSCKSNEVCESSYCGGCIARCVENTMVQQSSVIMKPPTSKPTSRPTARPSAKPISAATKPPTSKPTSKPTAQPSSKPVSGSNSGKPTSAAKVESVLEASKSDIDNNILLYQAPSNEWEPSSVYRYNDFVAALRVMYEDGVANKHFYMGDDSPNGHKYGLVNIAAFLAQSMKETIRYNACDENSWDLVNGVYPVSNACGQLGQSYQDYKCSAAEAHMQCEVDPDMKVTASTNSKWWGAPAPLFCAPKSEVPFTGYWDYTEICHNPWASPPQYCTDYKDQKAGGFNNDHPVANSAGRTDVEGCCFWGRGVIQTTGVCNFGKLNWYLGARAAREGRPSRYPDIDFCKTPDAICSSQGHKELKWIAGMFYWVESLQSYSSGGWDYITELKKWVDGGMSSNSFIDSVSGIVNRGCHSPPCASGSVDGQFERAANFLKVLEVFDLKK